MKTIIGELDLLKKTVNSIIQLNVRKKDLLSFATNLIGKEYLILVTPKNIVNFVLREKSTKNSENPNIVDIKSVFIEHLKTSRKLPKTIKQAEKAS